MATDSQQWIARTLAQAAVQGAFKGRKGHGVLRPEELAAIVEAACLVAIDITHQKPAPAEES